MAVIWLWILALALAIPTYGISIVVAFILSCFIGQNTAERNNEIRMFKDDVVSIVVARHQRNYKYGYFSNVMNDISLSNYVRSIFDILWARTQRELDTASARLGYKLEIKRLLYNQKYRSFYIDVICDILKRCENEMTTVITLDSMYPYKEAMIILEVYNITR